MTKNSIISADEGATFFRSQVAGVPAFVSCSSELPDIDAPLEGKAYDVKKEFLSVVPLLTYLKSTFRKVGWHPGEAGACWILDDPVLTTKYGFCDFELLDRQMKEHRFSTSIAMIPWNRRRTAPQMRSLVKNSTGRLSVSVHGCDHTAREFASADPARIGDKVASARSRMEEHRAATGIVHDPVMIFPQGVFSRVSLRSLQQHQFIATANTELLPASGSGSQLSIADVWSVAITKYDSFPLFTRRYPSAGLENFAFDTLLGKPCLVVEHHGFFKDKHAEVVRFVDRLNGSNTKLQWRSLGEVLRRSYQCRVRGDGSIQVRMFANEMVLDNSDDVAHEYRVEKRDEGSVGVTDVSVDGTSVAWQTDQQSLTFQSTVPAKSSVLVQVRYTPANTAPRRKGAITRFMKVAARRYLCEFRDNVLSRHDGVIDVARKAKRIVNRS